MKGTLALYGRLVAVTIALAAVTLGSAEAFGKVQGPKRFIRTVSGPPACRRQRTTGQYANHSTKLRASGGMLCIPSFGGFGGTMQYPRVTSSVRLTIRTSTENLYNEPLLGSGTPLVYLNLHFHAGTRFDAHAKSRASGLTSASIQPGDLYTAYGIVAVGHLVMMFSPCYAVATQGPYGGVLPNLGNLFGNGTVTGAGYGVVEIYSGAQVSQAC